MTDLSSDELAVSERACIEHAARRWNAIAGLLNAFQSVVILMVITRVCDVYAAGVFTLAYANGNLFLNVGKYGMRSFQASDRPARFSFSEYRASRAITSTAMVVAGCAYIAYLALSNGYAFDKAATMVVLCLYEAVAAVEDVFHGNFQQHGRLDVAAKLLATRVFSTVTLMCILAAAFGALLPAVCIATVYTAAFLVFEVAFARRRHGLPVADVVSSSHGVGALLKTCFPLFLAAFMLFYIGNAPRYAIDALMDDAAQAYYGYIAMPVFVVGLLASFVYNPMIASLADQWREGQVRVFVGRFVKVAGVIVGLTAVCDAAAFLLGVPVLDFLYNADTAPYLGDLLVLVTGGGFYALVSLAVVGVTIIRFQRVLVPAYVLVAVAAWALSGWAVAGWGVAGAAWTYFASMAVLAVLVVSLFAVGIRVQRVE